MTEPTKSVDVAQIENAAQALQDHMEQFHGICLSKSEWDAAIKATRTPPGESGTASLMQHAIEAANMTVPEDAELPDGYDREYLWLTARDCALVALSST